MMKSFIHEVHEVHEVLKALKLFGSLALGVVSVTFYRRARRERGVFYELSQRTWRSLRWQKSLPWLTPKNQPFFVIFVNFVDNNGGKCNF